MIAIIGNPTDEKLIKVKSYKPKLFVVNIPISSKDDPEPLLNNHVSVPTSDDFILYTGLDDKKVYYVDARKNLGVVGFFTDLKLARVMAIDADMGILEIPESQLWIARIVNDGEVRVLSVKK